MGVEIGWAGLVVGMGLGRDSIEWVGMQRNGIGMRFGWRWMGIEMDGG